MIDAHNHLGRWLSSGGDWVVPEVGDLLAVMDTESVELVVNLDGRWGQELEANLDRYDRAHPERFATFCHVDWSALGQDEGGAAQVDRMARQLQASAASGARGVKVWKDLGLEIRDTSGALVPPDDDRVVAVLRTAGELGLPVLIHTADPVAFFEPLTPQNERFDELQVHPEWWFSASGYPTFAELIAALDRLLAACPGTTFVGAHVGCWAEDLEAVGRMLRSHPHWNVDLGGRLGEIGRRPAALRRLVEAFPDRVLLGTDCFPPTVDDYARYRRFLESDDVAFDYSGEPTPPQGSWTIDGAALDPALLPALYSGNARRLLSLTD